MDLRQHSGSSVRIQAVIFKHIENHIEFCCANAQFPPRAKWKDMANIMKQGLAPYALGLVAVGSFIAAIATPAIAQDIYRQKIEHDPAKCCLLYTSPSPRDA